jgi:predicted RNA binding protein YcfA (HicA-like mRNA interferase family)
MGRLAGFRYREIVRKLRSLGFALDRQAAGSHEIWFHASANRYTAIPNHPGDMLEFYGTPFERSCSRGGRFA